MRGPAAVALVAFSTLSEAQLTARVSVTSAGLEAQGGSFEASISADSSVVAFSSDAANLVPGDTNGLRDVFVRDLNGAATELASGAHGGGPANGPSHGPVLSRSGQIVAFVSAATNLVAGGSIGASNVFVYDRAQSTTQLVSGGLPGIGVSAACDEVAISANARFVAFRSLANDLVAGDTNPGSDVFVYDRSLGTLELASVDSSGQQPQGESSWPSLSDDGRYIALESSGALASGGCSCPTDIYVRDRATGVVICVSVPNGGAPPNGYSYRPSISGNGQFVAFLSHATNMTVDSLLASENVFLREIASNRTKLISRSSYSAVNGDCGSASVSYDGRYVAFDTRATNITLADTSADWDIYVRDRWADVTVIASLSQAGLPVDGDAGVLPARFVSSDGQTVVFVSTHPAFVPSDLNGASDAFIHGRGIPPAWLLCFGDGSLGTCPCGNAGGYGRGCENSSGSGGAMLFRTGTSHLSFDSLALRVHGEPANVFNFFLQADVPTAPVAFGDGFLCISGHLVRLYTGFAVNDSIVRPGPSDAPVSMRAAALGSPIPMGSTRLYQVLYRDPVDSFCPAPSGANFNLTQALALVWGP